MPDAIKRIHWFWTINALFALSCTTTDIKFTNEVCHQKLPCLSNSYYRIRSNPNGTVVLIELVCKLGFSLSCPENKWEPNRCKCTDGSTTPETIIPIPKTTSKKIESQKTTTEINNFETTQEITSQKTTSKIDVKTTESTYLNTTTYEITTTQEIFKNQTTTSVLKTFPKDVCTIFQINTGKKFCISKNLMNFSDAVQFCKSVGAGLATKSIRDSTERRLIAVSIVNYAYFWVGMHDARKDNVWVYLDGVLSNKKNTKWIKGQPENREYENCGYIYKVAMKMADDLCSNKRHALCE